ncbi:peptidyl-prolyl cis-trans isomerase [Svornostia abyssi]|uniref:Peptidyl-prolyl cis-trans isomerase n=1 Tax=Svornostia abyssi TaxID=2898438 RepID=A0ABY5PMI6_9ACTN|nr:peptidyl-prolyl cis-trans isomerase [Parviterribacteraceae bacterium J379]
MAERFGWRAALLGALLVVVLVPGVAQSDGAPTDVIATVETQAPVVRADFDHWMAIAAAQSGQTPGARPIPVPDHPEYRACMARVSKTKAGRGKTPAQRRAECRKVWEGLRDQVLGFLLAASWIKGEAAERGITVTSQEIARAFATQKKQAFPKEADYQRFLKQSGSTEEDIRFQLEVELLQRRLVARATKGAGRVTQAQIEAYYRENREQFATPESRDLRVVLTKSRARAVRARRAVLAGQSWPSVAKRYSIDRATREQGGKLLGVTEGQQERPLDRAVFRARRGEIVGPVRTDFGYYVFKVSRITPSVQQTLKEATATIKSLLASQNQQQALDAFVAGYRAKWTARTRCLAGYVIEDCSATLPPPAPPA